MKARNAAAEYVATNWRIQKRLPRLTLLAIELGFITPPVFADYAEWKAAVEARGLVTHLYANTSEGMRVDDAYAPTTAQDAEGNEYGMWAAGDASVNIGETAVLFNTSDEYYAWMYEDNSDH